MREHTVESHLCSQVRRHGGRALKWISPGYRGVPDRLVIMPCARPGLPQPLLVECKAPGRRRTPLQRQRAGELAAYGATAVRVRLKTEVNALLADWCDGSCRAVAP